MSDVGREGGYSYYDSLLYDRLSTGSKALFHVQEPPWTSFAVVAHLLPTFRTV